MVEIAGQPSHRRHNRVLWFVLVMSILSVILLRWFSGEGVTALDLLAVGLAAAAVGGYATYAWRASRHSELPIGRDQAGDNAYYIGLLLTFASLGVALVKLVVLIEAGRSDSGGSEAAAQIAQLIPDFGVALASTIFGIAARLWLQQQRVSPAEASELARRELERGVARFTESLQVATGTISTSTTAIRFGVAKQLEEAAFGQVESFEEAETLIRDAAKEVASGFTQLAQMLAEVNLKVGAELSSLKSAVPGIALQELAVQARETGAAVANMEHEFGKASEHAGAFSRQVDALEKRLAAVAPVDAAERLNALIQDAALRSERIVEAIDRNDAQVVAVEGLLRKAVPEAKAIKSVSRSAARAAGRVENTLSASVETAETLKGGLLGLADRADRYEKGIQSAVEKTTSALQQTESAAATLDKGVSTVVRELGVLENDIRAMKEKCEDAKADVTKAATTMSNLLPEEEAKTLRTAANEARRRLVELAVQTDGDTIANAIVGAVDNRLLEFEGKLTEATARIPELEPTRSRLDGDRRRVTSRRSSNWFGRWGSSKR